MLGGVEEQVTRGEHGAAGGPETGAAMGGAAKNGAAEDSVTAGAAAADGAAQGEAAGGVATEAAVTVPVPLNRRALGPIAPDRVRALRRHLVESLRAERELKRPERFDRPPVPDPAGFVGEVARAACTLCGGWCCKGGEEHAYLDERTMARVRRARPELEARAVIRLYVERVPDAGYAGSCVFHGAQGCTLDRTLRSDVCNLYFCSGLGKFVKDGAEVAEVLVVARDGGERRSQVLAHGVQAAKL